MNQKDLKDLEVYITSWFARKDLLNDHIIREALKDIIKSLEHSPKLREDMNG